MKVIFFGTPQFASDFLIGILADPAFEVVGVVTQPDEPAGRKKILTPSPVKAVALEHNLPVLQPTKLKDHDFLSFLQASQAEVGVIVAYGRILPDQVLTIMQHGCVNVHPSLLPKYRGPSPIITAIANGDHETGVSIMKLATDMDAGPILAQQPIAVSDRETAFTLTQKVVDTGIPLLIQTLKDYVVGISTPREQDHERVTFCKLLSRQDGVINWTEPAEVIERKVRAYSPWPGTFTDNLKIFSVGFSDFFLMPGEQKIYHGQLFIGTGTTALNILEVQPAGGKRMLTADYVRGLRK